MASGRFISSTLGDSEKFSSLTDPRYQVAFVLIVTWADAEGRFIADPITLNGKLFTRLGWTPDLVRAALDELHEVGLVTLYLVEGKPYGVVAKFHQHNTITRKADGTPAREAASKLPPPPEQPRSSGDPPQQSPLSSSAATAQQHRSDRAAATPEVEVEVEVQGEVEEEQRAREARAGARNNGKPKNKPKKPREPTFDPNAVQLPDFVSPDVWRDFVTHRREIHKRLTPRATELILADLAKTPLDADEMLRTSIKRGWTGVFPLDRDKHRDADKPPTALDQYTERGL